MDIPLTDHKVPCYDRQDLMQKIWAASNIGQNGDFFVFEKRDSKISLPPNSIPYLSVSHKSKVLNNFRK